MSQEAANTFSEGLIMDLNPLTTPNNVLTNCLNGTFITFNGNEFVLQNDMGNGRVETAYLPSGYVPVGIKEHGGIIYVASYNPLTNRSQIGSFPSPERNISSEELNTPNSSLLWEDFWSKPEGVEGENILTSTVSRIQVSSNIVRSGDKFSIMFDTEDFNSLSQWISNFNNTSDGKIKYHHNKLLTIQIATEDSSGNLIDITEVLKRTQTTQDKSNAVIEFDPNTLPQIKFNSGYFIQEYTAGDTNDLTRFRESKALNTYNNKISGNLYVVATLNTITYYNVSLFGYKNPNEKNPENPLENAMEVTLPNGKNVTICAGEAITCTEVEYQYNCPDGYRSDLKDNEISEFPSDYCPSDVFIPNKVLGGSLLDALYWDANTSSSEPSTNKWSLEYPVSDYQSSESEYYYPKYDKTTGLYTLKELLLGNVQEKEDKLISSGGLPTEGILQFDLTPYMTYGELNGLKTTVGLNLSLLGSGTTDLTTWKYYINQNNVDITWGFSSYPLYQHEVKGILFEFKELSQNSENQKNYALYISGRESYNGIFTNSVQLVSGNIYVVKITVFQGPIGDSMGVTLKKGDLDTDLIASYETPDSITETVFWRTLICDQSYNQYYSTTKDMTKEIQQIDVKLIGNTSALYTRDNQITADEVNLLYNEPVLEQGYEVKYVHNNIKVNLEYTDTYQVENSLFELDPEQDLVLYHTITNGRVIINKDINVQTENVTFISDYEIKKQLNSDNGINIGSDSLTILLDIPIHYDYSPHSKFVEFAYRPLKIDNIRMIGSKIQKDQLFYSLPWWKSGKNKSDRAVDLYRMLSSFQKQFYGTTGSTNDHASFKADGVDKFNWGYSSILGESPVLVFVSSNGDPRTNIRKGTNGVEYEHIQVYAKSTDGGYHMILFCRNKPIRNNETDKVYWHQSKKDQIDSLTGDPVAIINELFLERIYTYQEYNNNVTYYGLYGYKYINDINTQCQIDFNVTSAGYFIKYKDDLYHILNIKSWLNNIDQSILNSDVDNSFILTNLTPNLIEINESYSISVPIVFTGSYLIYNQFQTKMASFNDATIAMVDYHNRNFFLQESDNSPLIRNYWYYLYDINEFNYDNPEIYNTESEIGLTEVPNWLSTYFQLTDGIPLIYPNNSRNAYWDFYISKASENHDHGWNMSEVLVNTQICGDRSFPLSIGLANEMAWITTDSANAPSI